MLVAGESTSGWPEREMQKSLGREIVPRQVFDPKERERMGLRAVSDGTPELFSFLVELNLLFPEGLEAAASVFRERGNAVMQLDGEGMARISEIYFKIVVTLATLRNLVELDSHAEQNTIHRIWPDFEVKALIDRSVVTVKADAAVRSFAASGDGIVWAVVDSGIDATHPHFAAFENVKGTSVRRLHRDFTHIEVSRDATETKTEVDLQGSIDRALTDGLGHGTHVAGIIAGGYKDIRVGDPPADELWVFERTYKLSSSGVTSSEETPERRSNVKRERIHGVAPACQLVSYKVLDDRGVGNVTNVIKALYDIRKNVNADPKLLRIHGINISLGYEFDARMFACGQSPICVEVDRLVKSGVVVVVAAGNTGYGSIDAEVRRTNIGITSSINDPGNAALAITVGSTHRDAPHTYGISYFSSKGPTGDGRLKPDLVAPGERITSCAVSRKRPAALKDPSAKAVYIDESGTSMAAPHVSGAIAGFLSVRGEFIQRPEEVKRVFLNSATPLGRERYFEGHGLVDLMRAIQSV